MPIVTHVPKKINYFFVNLVMVVEIKKTDTPEEISKKLNVFSEKKSEERKNRLNKFFGILKLDEDPVKLQRRWRDEW